MTPEAWAIHYELRTLGERFADTANRRDFDGFVDLWTEDGLWEIGPPIDVRFTGRADIRSGIERMLGLWDFFVQLPTAFDVRIHEDKALAYWTVHEIARRKDATEGNDNLSLYLDDCVRVDGRWLFQRRCYRTIYSDSKPLNGHNFHLDPADLNRIAGPLATDRWWEKAA